MDQHHQHQLLNKMTSWIPWTRSEKRPSHEYEEPNLLLSLLHPDVTDVVLKCLDFKSLLALRLVCKRTKLWVDHPKYLSSLQITLHSSVGAKKVRKVIRSKTDFCNFKFGYEKRNNEDLILSLGQRFGHGLKILDLNTMTSHSLTINLLSLCPTLESLTIIGLNLAKVPATWVEDMNGISDVLSNLKFLSIGNVLFLEEDELSYVKSLLLRCTKLQSLRLPYVTFKSKGEVSSRDKILSKYLIDPVTTSIRNRAQNSPSQPNLKYLVLEYVNPLPMTSNLFLKLAKTCHQYKTILHNVHQSHLRCLDPGNQEIQEIIGTLDGLNENIRFGRLINLKCISIWVSSALTLTDVNYNNPRLPKLENINLYLDTVEVDSRVNRLIKNVLKVERPNVTSLKISFNSRGGTMYADVIKGIDITLNFQNLRKLDIYQWDAVDEEFLVLWNGLGCHRIEDLSLLLCTNLSDRGILGDDLKKPAILNLTVLKELHISSLYGSITDASVQRAIRNMPLLKLRLYSQSITYDGITSLLDGVFHTKIDYIHCSKPLDCSQKEFYYLVKDILNAKKCPDFHKKKHLRRRSQPMIYSEPSDDD